MPGRKLGLVAATALVMGTMIGSGVFLLPASLAPFGWNAVGGWILTIAGALVLAWVLAQLTRAHPGHGNATGFVGAAFGPLVEFLIAWSYLVAVWTAVVTIAAAGVSYASSLLPTITASSAATILSVLALIWVLTAVNLRSVHAAGSVQVVTLAIKVLPLLVVITLAVMVVAGGRAEPPPFEASSIGLASLGSAATLTLWALLGFECASIAAGQVEDPERNVPRATMWGTALTGVLYLLVCSAVALLLPADIAATSPAPFSTFVERYWAPGPAALVAVFAFVSCVGALNGMVLLSGELPRAMAQDGVLPRWLGATGGGTPRRALVVSSLIASVFVIFDSSGGLKELFEFLLLLSTSATLWLYLAFSLAAWKLRIARVFAAIGALYSLWTLWGAGIEASALSLVLMLAGLPLYWWTRRVRNG